METTVLDFSRTAMAADKRRSKTRALSAFIGGHFFCAFLANQGIHPRFPGCDFGAPGRYD
jgi:hypothetical protein